MIKTSCRCCIANSTGIIIYIASTEQRERWFAMVRTQQKTMLQSECHRYKRKVFLEGSEVQCRKLCDVRGVMEMEYSGWGRKGRIAGA